MDFMTSLFGGEPDGRPKPRRKVRVSMERELEVNGLRGKAVADKANAMAGNLPPEEEEGNVEYKLKLVNPSESRLQHLVTQLKWRLREGNGEAFYEIGVEDNGLCTGLVSQDLAASLSTLGRMADALGASLTVLREREVGLGRRVAEVLVRRVPESQEFLDLRVAVVGNADAGKSTLLGVLTSGELDDGRGKARLNLFRHLHEVQSGRTSSISLEIAGFDVHGNPVNYAEHSVEEICEKSTKLVTFIDLAGHHKFLRTTVFGLTGYKPHFACLVVAGNQGLAGTAREHLAITAALQIPLFVVMSKTDVASKNQLTATRKKLEDLLKGPGLRRTPLRIESEDDAISAAQNLDIATTVPVFAVSSCTGQGLSELRTFLNLLPPTLSPREREAQLQFPTRFHIDEIFNVSGVGVVAAGLLETGVLREGDRVQVGPDIRGVFRLAEVESVQRSKAACRLVSAGQAASVALSPVSGEEETEELVLRKGMVLLPARAEPVASWSFVAEVFLLHHLQDFLCIGFQTTVHIGNVRQTATIVDLEGSCLKKQAPVKEGLKVVFLFQRYPEYLTVGARLLFRERRTKGIGQVTDVCVDPSSLPNFPRSRTF